MIFPGDFTPIREVVLQDAKISKKTQEKLDCLLKKFADIMLPCSSDIGYQKLIKMDIETNQNIPIIASKLYKLPLKHHARVKKELEDLKRWEFYKEAFPHAPLIVILPEKCPPSSLAQAAKRFCADYTKLNAQLPTIHKNKSTGAVTLVDISKIDEMLARLPKLANTNS